MAEIRGNDILRVARKLGYQVRPPKRRKHYVILDGPRIGRVLEAGPDSVNISLDGADAATHDRAIAFLSHAPQVVSWALLEAARADPVARRHLRRAGPARVVAPTRVNSAVLAGRSPSGSMISYGGAMRPSSARARSTRSRPSTRSS